MVLCASITRIHTTSQRLNKSLSTTSVTSAYQQVGWLKEASFTQQTVLFSNGDYTLQFV